MKNLFEISLLLDFYGQLLTQRQLELMELHYNMDYSLGEISQHLEISRQGAYDGIKKAKGILTKMEAQLGLVKRFASQREKVLEARQILKYLRVLDTDKRFLEKIDELDLCIHAIIHQEQGEG